MSNAGDLDRFDAHAEQLTSVIDSAAASQDPDRIHNAQEMANEYIGKRGREVCIVKEKREEGGGELPIPHFVGGGLFRFPQLLFFFRVPL